MIMATRIQHWLRVDETDIITSSATSPKNYIIATNHNQYRQISRFVWVLFLSHRICVRRKTSPIQDIGILNKNKGD